MGLMAYKAKNEVTADSRRIIDVCRDLLARSGIGIKEFLATSGLGNNYWYMRMRYEAPLNTSDVEHIAAAFHLKSLDIYTMALGDEKARQIKTASEEERIASALQRLHDDPMALAAYMSDSKQENIYGEAGPDYDEPA